MKLETRYFDKTTNNEYAHSPLCGRARHTVRVVNDDDDDDVTRFGRYVKILRGGKAKSR